MRAPALTIGFQATDREDGLNRRLTGWLCRLAGLALFALGLFYWIRLVGIFEGPLWRFDLMPLSWRLAAPTLAVLCPVAGIGLWMLASWGAVIWVLVAATEGVMHLGFPEIFGAEPVRIALHASGLGLLAALRLGALAERRRNRRLQSSGRAVRRESKRDEERKSS